MAKVSGIWRSRSKISKAEIEADRHRTEERLAAIFGLSFDSPEPEPEPEPASAADDAGTPPPEPEARSQADERPLPGAILTGSRDLVGVMAVGEDDAPAVDAPDHPGRAAASRQPSRSTGMSAGTKGAKAVITPTPKAATARAGTPKAATARVVTPKAATARAAPGRARAKAAPEPVAARIAASCPYCAILLQPEPTSSRRCAQCGQRIIVKHIDGRTVFLAEAVLPVFEAERRRRANASRLARESHRWLHLAAAAGAPSERVEAQARAAQARPSEDAVAAAQRLYAVTAERAYQVARRARRWTEASRVRRDHAMVLHRAAESPVPPSEEVVRLHRESVAAELRGIAEMTREAELVAAACCDTCRADDHRVVRISAELRAPSLPHPACPKGLCSCRWDLPMRHRATVQRYVRRRAAIDPRGPGDQAPPRT
ncbi:MAG: hypothetical protein ACYC65_03730 [Candidatus Limnocylindrales bacterium]